MGEWMGFPYESNYRAREAKYLAYEGEVLEDILTSLEAGLPHLDQNVIVDTTGSVIYTDPALLHRLRQQTTLVYLDTPPEVQGKMRLAYIDSPPPVLWRDKFHQLPGESNEAALARSYPELLASRTRLYKQWAEVTLDYYKLRQPGFTVDDFLNEIEQTIKVPVE